MIEKSAILPIPFIVGVGRSGTTLLRLMLDAHSELAIPPETHFIGKLAAESELDRKKFAEIVLSVHSWPDFGISETTFLTALARIEPFSAAAGLNCFYRIYAVKHGKNRWGDKTPTYINIMLPIAKLFPQARFIHIIRDGRDSAISYRSVWFGPGDDLEAHAKMWTSRIETARTQAQNLKYYIEVRFDELVRDTETVLRRVCEFLELEFQSKMLDYFSAAEDRISEQADRYSADGRFFVTAEAWTSIFRHTFRPPDSSRIGRWKGEMTEKQQKAYENIAGPLLCELGYETRFYSPS